MNDGTVMKKGLLFGGLFGLMIIGAAGFFAQLGGPHPERAWQAYHINFLFWSAVAQGAFLFSMVMHMARARWSGPLSGLSEAFAGFFPLSFVLFLLLFLGRESLFPWLHQDLHGKEVWLNMPFLFTRDLIGLLILYGLGFGYLRCALSLKTDPCRPAGGLRGLLAGRPPADPERCRRRKTLFAVLYAVAFACVLSLIAFDLVMSMDPHWISTLFGAYAFVKAFYIGLGALFILAALHHLHRGPASTITPAHFHDLGKLFFGFCLVWADFFYCQFVVIWYGNLPEETHYIIQRTMIDPWRSLAWGVFAVCFIIPFIILLNRRVKMMPAFMIVLCGVIIVGIWLEHLLLLGPAWYKGAVALPLSVWDGIISLGFLGLMAASVAFFLNLFPELVPVKQGEVN